MLRFLKWLVIVVLLLVVLVFVVVPLVMNTESGRRQVAEVLSRGLHRQVALKDMEIGLFFTSFGISGLTIANPEGFPDGNLISAESLEIDSNFRRILDGQVKGSVAGKGLVIHLIQKGGKTNLDGLGGSKQTEKPAEPDKPAPPEEPGPGPGEQEPGATGRQRVTLDLSLDVSDSRLVIEDLDKGDKLVLEGVSIAMQFTNREGAGDTGLKVRVSSIESGTVKVTDIEIDARQAGDWIDLEAIRAKLPGEGSLQGNGRLHLRGGNDWNAKLDAKRVTLGGDVAPFVASVYPIAASAGDQLGGVLDGTFELKGRGLSWEVMKPSLAGKSEIHLSELQLPPGSLLVQAAELAGRKDQGAIKLNSAGAVFSIADGWMSFSRLSASGDEVRYDFAGKVSLDGKLDLTMDLAPLVKQFGGGERYAAFKQYVDKIPPLRIGGTTEAPKLLPPSEADLKKGILDAVGEKAGSELGGLLDKIGKKDAK